MICVTGNEREPQKLLDRLGKRSAYLHEARLDLLKRIPKELAGNLPNRHRMVVTCRPLREGGGFDGSEEERTRILCEAASSNPAYVDIELSTPDWLRARLISKARSSRVIVSAHFDAGFPQDAARIVSRMEESGAHIVKFAAAIDDAAGMGRLLDLKAICSRPLVAVGMGRAAIASRILYKRFGSLFTYVASSEGAETASGQPALEKAVEMGIERAERAEVLGVIGGEQVVSSRGVEVYNRIFQREGLPFVYLPFPTERPEAALELLRRLGFRGVSVTMPHKQALLRLLDRPHPLVRRIGAANTVVSEGGRLEGFNTDYAGVLRCLGKRATLRGKTGVILGAGGAAAAAAFALSDEGCSTLILNRTLSKAVELAEACGGIPGRLEELGEHKFDILINATPVGSLPDETPKADPAILAGKLVFDMVSRPVKTRLLREAEKAGAEIISGLEMWAEQGSAQMKILAGVELGSQRLMEEGAEPSVQGEAGRRE